ncbi:uncharacterized protein V1513DRAFT_454445 [Lipomyces chichibuensis]|uniref:uncharacterized protein n=1 Tax=Lipomyces chichibuensis TaxID=1546026 RepID=UPI003343121B
MPSTDILTTIPGILCPTVVFVTTAIFVRGRVLSHGPLPMTSTLIKFNNRLYGLASLWFLLTILLSRMTASYSDSSLLWLLPTDGDRRYAYHLSKFYEYIDILLVLANGGQVALHFGFHHLTTPVLTYVRVLKHHEGWELFATLNALHHVLMYLYFGGISAFRPILRWTGTLQLVMGILAEIRIIWVKLANGEVVWPNMIAGFLLSCYMMLFVREIRMEETEKEEEKNDQDSSGISAVPTSPLTTGLKVD